MELALLRRHPHRCERDRRVDIAQDEVGVIAIDQLSGFCNADGNFICRILDQQLHLAAENAALSD